MGRGRMERTPRARAPVAAPARAHPWPAGAKVEVAHGPGAGARLRGEGRELAVGAFGWELAVRARAGMQRGIRAEGVCGVAVRTCRISGVILRAPRARGEAPPVGRNAGEARRQAPLHVHRREEALRLPVERRAGRVALLARALACARACALLTLGIRTGTVARADARALGTRALMALRAQTRARPHAAERLGAPRARAVVRVEGRHGVVVRAAVRREVLRVRVERGGVVEEVVLVRVEQVVLGVPMEDVAGRRAREDRAQLGDAREDVVRGRAWGGERRRGGAVRVGSGVTRIGGGIGVRARIGAVAIGGVGIRIRIGAGIGIAAVRWSGLGLRGAAAAGAGARGAAVARAAEGLAAASGSRSCGGVQRSH
ncbi:hypothetical protein FB451DRAFT_139357 [Mycena latifolia]|nr:hypothetical protein FB451DRAFT_139357 [Mycena latifolia]